MLTATGQVFCANIDVGYERPCVLIYKTVLENTLKH